MLLELLRHPGKLALNLAMIALLVFSLVSGMKRNSSGGYLDFRVLHGVYLAAMLFIMVSSVLTGVKSGATFFKMSDVNFLFVSPISPKEILAYGLVKQMLTSMFTMLFLLFYGGTAAEAFGVVPWQLVTLIAGIALMVFTIQLITLLVYSFASGRPRRVLLVKACVYAVPSILVAFILASFLANGSGMEALYAAVASPYLAFMPVVGWIKGMVFGVIEGNVSGAVIYSVLNLLTLAGSIFLFARSNPDYYEDVLQATESTFQLKKSVREGRPFNNRNVKLPKVTDTGIHHGWGANTFFFKHLRQDKRKSRIPFVRTYTLVITAANLVLAVFLRSIFASDSNAFPTGMLMAGSLAVSCYILFFFNAAGDWSQELMKPYIYLVPESPFSKLIWASMSTVLKPAVDGIILFTVLGIFLRANPATAILCMLIYASTGFLFTAGNVLSQRLFGQVANKGLLMFGYMFVLMALFAPGIGISALLYVLAGNLPGILIGLPDFVWNVLVSVGIFAACRNILSTVEFNQP